MFTFPRPPGKGVQRFETTYCFRLWGKALGSILPRKVVVHLLEYNLAS